LQQFLYGQACEGDAVSLARRCLEQLGEVPEEASLGFVYATDRLGNELGIILEMLRQAAPGVHWIGSVGMGIAATAREYYEERALVVMLTDIPPEQFRVIPNTDDMFAQIPENISGWIGEQGCCFGLLHAEPTYVATSAFINSVREAIPSSFINGGLSSAEGSSYQIADGVFDDGISGVLFSPRVEVITDHTQGCSPIGPIHQVDEAEQNLVIRLDQRPALEVLKEDVGEVLSRDLRRLGGYIFVGLPIHGSDTGDYLVRNLMGLDIEQQLIAVGDYMEEREQLMFCRRDGNTAREDMQRMLQRIEKRLAGRTIRGGVYISCIGRGRSQFGGDSAELKLISDALGSFPLVGFFANGELYNSRLYGYTGVLTLFV
jgi:small ligand-binding sensory domain FIST